MSASVMGRVSSCPGLSFRWLLALSVVSRCCHIIRSEEAVSPSFQRSLQLLRTLRLRQLHRPSVGTTGLVS